MIITYFEVFILTILHKCTYDIFLQGQKIVTKFVYGGFHFKNSPYMTHEIFYKRQKMLRNLTVLEL